MARIEHSFGILRAEVSFCSCFNFVPELSFRRKLSNILYDTVDDMAKLDTKTDVLVIFLNLFRSFDVLLVLLCFFDVLQVSCFWPQLTTMQ